MRQRARSGAVIGAVLLSALLTATGTATAVADDDSDVGALGNTWVYLHNSSSPVGTSASMVHVDDGDIFRVWDDYADGHGVRGTLQILNVRGWETIESKYNGGGAGTYVQFNRNVLELWRYRMRVCTVDGAGDTTPVRCSDWKHFNE